MNLDAFWSDYGHFVDCAHSVVGRDLTDSEDLMLFANFLRTRFGLNPIPGTSLFSEKRTKEKTRPPGRITGGFEAASLI